MEVCGDKTLFLTNVCVCVCVCEISCLFQNTALIHPFSVVFYSTVFLIWAKLTRVFTYGIRFLLFECFVLSLSYFISFVYWNCTMRSYVKAGTINTCICKQRSCKPCFLPVCCAMRAEERRYTHMYTANYTHSPRKQLIDNSSTLLLKHYMEKNINRKCIVPPYNMSNE